MVALRGGMPSDDYLVLDACMSYDEAMSPPLDPIDNLIDKEPAVADFHRLEMSRAIIAEVDRTAVTSYMSAASAFCDDTPCERSSADFRNRQYGATRPPSRAAPLAHSAKVDPPNAMRSPPHARR